MTRALLLSACVLASGLACTDSRRTPAPPAVTGDAGRPAPSPMDAGAEDAGVQDAGLQDAGLADAGSPGSTPDAGGACSARGLSATPPASPKPLPPAVESMRRRIVAAAVACDYAALAALADEKGKGLRFSFGADEDVAAYWREQESQGEPTLARLVKLLGLPFIQEDALYVWPRAFRERPIAQDFEDLKKVYTAEEMKTIRLEEGGYVGLRIGISKEGDWQLAVAGD